MNYTQARCGHPILAIGAPGSTVRRMLETRPCSRPRCQSELPDKFSDAECEAYIVLMRVEKLNFLVDLVTKRVHAVYRGKEHDFPNLLIARQTLGY